MREVAVRQGLIDAPDNPGFWKKWENGEWEPETKWVLAEHLHPGATFIDIGAWIGPVSLWALEMHADVVAYEPDPVAATIYRENVHGARLYEVAVSTDVGWSYLDSWGHQDTKGRLGNSMSRLAPEGLKVATVDAETVLRQASNPALIKIDVEGGELSILPDFLRLARCPILVAWHQPWWPHGPNFDLSSWEFRGPIGGFGQSLLIPR